jgi:hypothetical protein
MFFDIPAAIEAGSNLIGKIIDKIAPDADVELKAKLNAALQEMQNEYMLILSQLDINKEEAKSASVLVAGARPYVLWVCGTSLAYVSLLEPILRFLAVVIFGYTGEFPTINTDLTMQVLLGILGLGGYRTVEKLKGVSRDKIK